MKHQIEFKLGLPKFLDPMFDKFTPEEKVKFGKMAMAAGSVMLGMVSIYLWGYNRGIKKSIDNRGIYIIRSGGD